MMPALHATCSADSVSPAVDTDTPDPTPTGVDRLVGRVLDDRYRIENVVTAGANTVITEAIDTEGNRPVTVKIVRPELAVTSGVPPGLPAAGRGRHVAQPSEHRISARLGRDRTRRRVHGVLGRRVPRRRKPSRSLRPWATPRPLAGAGRRPRSRTGPRGRARSRARPHRTHAFEAGVRRGRRLRIVDVAMAQLLGAEAWQEPATVATHVARYASPEQALGLDVDEKTDVYALSLCLIESITGKVPFAGDSTVSTLAARVGKLMPVTADMGSLASVLDEAAAPIRRIGGRRRSSRRRSSRPPRPSLDPSRSRCSHPACSPRRSRTASNRPRRQRPRRAGGGIPEPDSEEASEETDSTSGLPDAAARCCC